MTRAETDKLFSLMLELYDGHRKLKRPNAKAAWYVALEPYDYETVRGNLMRWYRGPHRGFVPDPKDLMPPAETVPTSGAEGAAPYTQNDVERAYCQALWARAGHTGLVPEGWTGKEEMSA